MNIDSAIERVIERGGRVSRNDPAITPAFVREVLARDSRHARFVVLKLLVPVDLADSALLDAWWLAIETLQSLSLTYAWGSKPRRERFRKLAAHPAILAAIQGAAAHGEHVPRDMLAVLVADGSDESIDALIPHLGGALDSRDARLDWLRTLKPHATSNPRLAALFAELEASYADRNSRSPALALGPVIGVGELDVLMVRYACFSDARVQVNATIDSQRPPWFRIFVGGGQQHSRFTPTETDDAHDVGPCDPLLLPSWLAHVAQRLHVTWSHSHLSTNLRGKKRERLQAWLAGR